MPPRPILDHFQSAPVVRSEPLDDRVVADVIPDQVQIALTATPDGPRLDPLTPAAHSLLFGPNRERANHVLGGVADALNGARVGNAPVELRGLSLARDDAGYAVNTMMSLVESGYVPDVVGFAERSGPDDPDRFRTVFQSVADSYSRSRANNSGWMDLGPKLSSQLLSLIEQGPRAGVSAAHEAAQVIAHEQEHSVSPIRPDTPEPYVWLEEGIAEALSWWPGRIEQVQDAMGIETPGSRPDRFLASPDSLASPEYRMRHNAVLGLLSLAGVSMFDAGGKASSGSAHAARQLLQGDAVERVPRNLARAIARHRSLDSRHVPAIEQAIVATQGDTVAVRELAERLDQFAATTVLD